MSKLQSTIENIKPVDRAVESEARKHLDQLTKPVGSLGRLEDLAARYCLITGTSTPNMGTKRIVTFAADHGVADEGVSAYPKEVTWQMVMNMVSGGAAINVLARHAEAESLVVDIGVIGDFDSATGLVRSKVRPGTANMVLGPAMSLSEAEQAVITGIDLAKQAAGDGVTLLGTGDMGIANTTASSAIFATLLPCPVDQITGRGTGIDDETLEMKISVIKKALEVNKADLTSPMNVLAAVGGLEIAGICGLILGAAANNIPVVVDGFISSAGALVACRLNENVADYLFFSHLSHEIGHKVFFEHFAASPLLDLNMRLGEGSGAALAMSLVEASVRIYNEMATFASAGVSDKED